MRNVRFDPNDAMKRVEERVRSLPGLDELLKALAAPGASADIMADTDDDGRFHLPYSSDPRPIEEPWK